METKIGQAVLCDHEEWGVPGHLRGPGIQGGSVPAGAHRGGVGHRETTAYERRPRQEAQEGKKEAQHQLTEKSGLTG